MLTECSTECSLNVGFRISVIQVLEVGYLSSILANFQGFDDVGVSGSKSEGSPLDYRIF
jgi:hypothetical protein